MRPILFYVFGMPVASWHLFFALAGVAGFFQARFLAEKSRDKRVLAAIPVLFAIVYVSGWFGARAMSILVEQPDVRTPLHAFTELFSLGPMTFYGGALAGGVCGTIYLVRKHLPWGVLFDVSIPAAVLALGIGRIGCLLNGCDFGRPVAGNPSWAIVLPVLEDGIPRYPVQLEEAIFSLVLATIAGFLFLYIYGRQTKLAATGMLGATVLMVSAAHRFVNESFRGDPRGHFLESSLSTSQGISVLLLLLGCGLCVRGWLQLRR